MFKRLICSAMLFGMAANAPPALAQGLCASRDSVTKRLSDVFSERPIAGGLQSNQRVIEIWSSPETGSFTILLTRPDGISCIMSSGSHFHKDQKARKAGERSG